MQTTGLQLETVEKFRNVFARYPEIEKVTLYGSRAKGTHRRGSDIDFCVMAPGWTPSELSRLVTELDALNLPWNLDVNLEHFIHLPALREHIQRVGLTFYSRAETKTP